METKELRVDRIENGLAVAYDRAGNEYVMCQKIGDLAECDVLSAAVNERGDVVEVVVRREETERAKSAARQNLNELFDSQEEV